jgi:hypothetical protein
MRDLIDLIKNLMEDGETPKEIQHIKKNIVELLRGVEEGSILQKVLKTLQAGNIDKRIDSAIGSDIDARNHISAITSAIVDSEAPLEEKEKFLERFKKGIVNTSKLVDGKLHSFSDIVGPGFPTEVFKKLVPGLIAQGIGPGELALASLSPKIKSVGAVGGGGDIVVGNTRVEVKTSVTSGGRWVNARKANVDLQGIKTAIEAAMGKPLTVKYLSADEWVNTVRPIIQAKNPKVLSNVCATIANGMFSHTNNSKYKAALEKGDAQKIADMMLTVGYENYKAYSNFAGILLMDLSSESMQYFTSYDEMKGHVHISTPYIWCSGGDELMPKVKLEAGRIAGYGGFDVGGKKKKASPEVAIPSEKDFTQQAGQIVNPKTVAPIPAGVGRKKR